MKKKIDFFFSSKKSDIAPKPSVVKGGETCNSGPCCYGSKSGDITTRGDTLQYPLLLQDMFLKE